MTKPPMVRLDRLLGALGYGTRKEVSRLAAAGAVMLDGEPLLDASTKVPAGPDLPARMTVQGAPVDPPTPLTLVMHKPVGVVCSHREPGRSVYELLPRRWRARTPALSTVGRLDKDTSGLLLITDDGALLHRIISPRAEIAKRYRAVLARPLEGHEAARFAEGLMLEGETAPLLPAGLEPLGPQEAYVTIREGRYHQVRRMFAAVGNHVEALHRDRVGGLDLPADLAPGAWRMATPEELARLFGG
ncbi:MAG: 16S rRNA pseudouridine(516) synthase [Caulobacteraceae bacterium]